MVIKTGTFQITPRLESLQFQLQGLLTHPNISNTLRTLLKYNLVEQTETHVIVGLFLLLNLLLFFCGSWGSGAALLNDWCSSHGKLGWVLVPKIPLIS